MTTVLPNEVVAGLEASGAFVLLLAVFAELLGRLSGQDDVVIGDGRRTGPRGPAVRAAGQRLRPARSLAHEPLFHACRSSGPNRTGST